MGGHFANFVRQHRVPSRVQAILGNQATVVECRKRVIATTLSGLQKTFI